MLLPPYRDAVRALNLPDVGDTVPALAQCPQCGGEARIVGQLEPNAPSLFYCLACPAAGDIVDYVRMARKCSPQDAFVWLHAVTGWPCQEASWGEYVSARSPLDRATTVWQGMITANSHDTLLEELLTTELRTPEHAAYGSRWLSVTQPLVAAGLPSRVLRHGVRGYMNVPLTEGLLLFPLQTVPGRIVAFCALGGKKRDRLYYIPLHFLRKNRLRVREGGLYYHPETLRTFRGSFGSIVVYPNVAWAATAQLWHLLGSTKPLPIAAWASPVWGKRNNTHLPPKWAGYSTRMAWNLFDHTRLVLWLPFFSKEGLWHLLRLKCRASTLKIQGDPLTFVGAGAIGSGPEDVVRSVIENAIPWQEAGARLLFGRRDELAEAVIADALLQGIPTEDLLACCETRQQEQTVLRLLEQKGAGRRTDLFSGTMTETETGYYLEKNKRHPPVLVSDARIHVHRIIQDKKRAYQGVVLHNGAVLPFYGYEEVEKDTAQWLLAHCLTHGHPPPKVDPTFPRLLHVAMRLHPPSWIDSYSYVGWHDGRAVFVLPRFVLRHAGIVDSQLWQVGHYLVPGHPAWRIPVPRELAPHEVRLPEDRACREIYVASFVALLHSLSLPLRKKERIIDVLLLGPGASRVGAAVAKAIGCCPEKDVAESFVLLAKNAWPLYIPEWVEDATLDAAFALSNPREQGLVVPTVCAAKRKVRARIVHALAVCGPEQVSLGQEYEVRAQAVLSAYLWNLSKRNWRLELQGSRRTWQALLFDFAAFIANYGGSKDDVLAAESRLQILSFSSAEDWKSLLTRWSSLSVLP